MTFRVSCHTDSPNAVLFQNTRFENFERTSKHATGLRGIARNNQNLADAGLSAQPCQEVIEGGEILDTPGSDVRYRIHRFLAKARRQPYRVAQLRPGCVGGGSA